MLRKHMNILAPFPSGGTAMGKYGGGSTNRLKGSLLNSGRQVGISGGNYANVHRDRLGSADSVDHPVLKDPQQFGLGFEWHFPDFVQE